MGQALIRAEGPLFPVALPGLLTCAAVLTQADTSLLRQVVSNAYATAEHAHNTSASPCEVSLLLQVSLLNRMIPCSLVFLPLRHPPTPPPNHVGLVETHRLPKSPLLTSGLLSQAPIICVSQHLSELWEPHLLSPLGCGRGWWVTPPHLPGERGWQGSPRSILPRGFPCLTLPLLCVTEVDIKFKTLQWNA